MSSYYAKRHYRGEQARRYDSLRAARPKWQQEQAIVRRFLEGLAPGTRLLDVPVGTGRFLPFCAELGLRSAGADISPGMIGEARSVAGSLAGGFLDLQVADAERLPFADGAFEALVSHRFIKWLPDDQRVVTCLREFARVCRGTMLLQVKQPRGGSAAAALERPPDRARKLSSAEILELFDQAGVRGRLFDSFEHGKTREAYFLCGRAT